MLGGKGLKAAKLCYQLVQLLLALQLNRFTYSN
jgi:hypothetical protein